MCIVFVFNITTIFVFILEYCSCLMRKNQWRIQVIWLQGGGGWQPNILPTYYMINKFPDFFIIHPPFLYNIRHLGEIIVFFFNKNGQRNARVKRGRKFSDILRLRDQNMSILAYLLSDADRNTQNFF